MKCPIFLVVLATLFVTFAARADIGRGFDDELEITDVYTDLGEWLDVAPDGAVIDFVGFANGTQIDDEFSELGVNFIDGFYTVQDNSGANSDAFLDDFGLDGNSQFIAMQFDQTLHVIGAMFPGVLRFELYLDGEIVGWTENVPVTGTVGQFGGLITDVAFNQVLVIQDAGDVDIDNLYFSFEPIPAPGALALLGIAAIAGRTRRRRARET